MTTLDLPRGDGDQTVAVEGAYSEDAVSAGRPVEQTQEPLWLGSVLLLAVPLGLAGLDLMTIVPGPWGELGGVVLLVMLAFLIYVRLPRVFAE